MDDIEQEYERRGLESGRVQIDSIPYFDCRMIELET